MTDAPAPPPPDAGVFSDEDGQPIGSAAPSPDDSAAPVIDAPAPPPPDAGVFPDEDGDASAGLPPGADASDSADG